MTDTARDRDGAGWLDVAKDALAAQVALGRASADLARSALSGELDGARVGQAYAGAVRREGARYWRGASRLGADYLRDVAALGSEVATSVLDDVSRARRGGRPGRTRAPHEQPLPEDDPGWSTAGPRTPGEPAAAAVGLTLRGPSGGRATGSLTVSNRHPRARRIALSAEPLTGPDGAAVDGVALELVPARTTVPAGQERVVAVACDLATGVLAPGTAYTTTIQVSGGEEARVACRVEVL